MRDSLTRRRALSVAVGAAGIAVAPGCAGLPTPGTFNFDNVLVIDALASVSDPDPNVGELDPPSPSLLELRRQSAVTAVSMTMGTPGAGPGRFEEAMVNLTTLQAWLDVSGQHFTLISAAPDLYRAKSRDQLGIICNLQDTTALENEIDRVAALREAGLRVLQLTYNRENDAGFGCLAPNDAGVTTFGHEIIGAANTNRVVLDLSHAGPRTTEEAIEASTSPVVISHTGCRALVDFPRNVSDRALRALANKGGVVGIYFMPFLRETGLARAEDVIRHLEHAIDVCGEDHVGIGTDGSLTAIDDRGRQAHQQAYAARSARGVSAPGEGPDRYNYVEEYNRPDRLRLLSEDLSARGWPTRRIEKILGANFARAFGEVWGG